MKHVLVLFSGTHASSYLMASAVNLGRSTDSFLHAVFLNNDPHLLEYGYLFPNDLPFTENQLTGKSLAEEDREIMAANIKVFADECEVAGVKYQVEQQQFSLNELIKHSEFFDLLVVDAKANLYEYLLSDLLIDAHCPVLLTTAAMEPVDRLLLAYDGSFSSIYAIKMVTYLFPEWQDTPVDLIYIAPQKESHLPFDREMTSWLRSKYQKVETQLLSGAVRPSFVNFIKSKSANGLLVMGGFGRNALLRIFHKSLTEAIIKEVQLPVLITHK